jgi:hypothetical protein
MDYPMLMSIACGERRFVGFYDGPDAEILYGIYVYGTENYPVWLDLEEARFIITQHHDITTFDQSLAMARLGK